jgi:hypothetical protein
MMTQIKKPDLNAPRFRPTRHKVLDADFLKRFKKKFPQYNDIPDSKLREIVGVHNELLWKTAITERNGAEFPEGLGYLFIGSCKSPKKFNHNFALSLEEGVSLRHKNFESDNFLAKIFYTNYANKYQFQNSELWRFKGIRDFTRAVAQAYPENWKMYVQVDSTVHISKMFKKKRRSNWLANKVIVTPLEYNEFDMD